MTTKVSAFFDRCWEQVSYLHDRWQDEKEYEDWQDYIDSATKLVEKSGLEFIGLSKRPFKLTFQHGTRRHSIHIKASSASLLTEGGSQ